METNKLDPSKFYLVSGKTLAGIQDRQDRLWGGDNIQRGPGIFRRGSGSGGFSLAARTGGPQVPQSPSDQSFPFQISVKGVTSMGVTTYQYMVNLSSDLLAAPEPNTWQAITGLGTWYNLANTTPLSFSGSTPMGFFCYDIITLFISVAQTSSTAIQMTGAFIQNRINGSNLFDPTLAAWDASDLAYVTNDGASPPNQTGINFMLGYTVQPSGSGTAPPTLIQACTDHLLVQNVDINGEAAIYPGPSPYRRFGLLSP